MIEFPEDVAVAVKHLKTTLPLLTRNKLPPNPIHYGVWYLYASKRSTDLQRTLDTLINEGNYNDTQAVSLFRQFLLEEHNGEHRKASGKLNLLAQGIQDALRDTLQSANGMDRQLSESRDTIRTATRYDDLDQTVETLLATIDQLSASNRDYRRIAQSAESEIDRLKNELNRLQRASDIDDLTQLYNRSALVRESNRLLAVNTSEPVSLILMDIDHFKSINDRFGHLMGDRVLQRIGSLLLQQLRPNTMAARFGGEEFVILCPDTTLDEARMLAERLRDQMQRLRIKIRNSDTVLDSITASFGVATLHLDDSFDSLLERADKAMYVAKQSGRNATQTETIDAEPAA